MQWHGAMAWCGRPQAEGWISIGSEKKPLGTKDKLQSIWPAQKIVPNAAFTADVCKNFFHAQNGSFAERGFAEEILQPVNAHTRSDFGA